MDRDAGVLLDILLAVRDIREFVSGFDRVAFEKDRKTQAAVLHQFTIIGEAVRRLSEPFRQAHPQVPWAQIAGMRNRLIHEYERVDLAEVWNAVARDVPELIRAVDPLVDKQ